jgi:hypothetical protein
VRAPLVSVSVSVSVAVAVAGAGPSQDAVRHFGRAVGETDHMHRVSDRAVRRARAQEEWVA